jgi:hypothetical protein
VIGFSEPATRTSADPEFERWSTVCFRAKRRPQSVPVGPLFRAQGPARQPGNLEALSLGSAERSREGEARRPGSEDARTSVRVRDHPSRPRGNDPEGCNSRSSGGSVPEPLEETPVMSAVKAAGRGPDPSRGNPCRALAATSPVRRGGVGRRFISCGPRPRGSGETGRACGRRSDLRIAPEAILEAGLTEGIQTPRA